MKLIRTSLWPTKLGSDQKVTSMTHAYLDFEVTSGGPQWWIQPSGLNLSNFLLSELSDLHKEKLELASGRLV